MAVAETALVLEVLRRFGVLSMTCSSTLGSTCWSSDSKDASKASEGGGEIALRLPSALSEGVERSLSAGVLGKSKVVPVEMEDRDD